MKICALDVIGNMDRFAQAWSDRNVKGFWIGVACVAVYFLVRVAVKKFRARSSRPGKTP